MLKKILLPVLSVSFFMGAVSAQAETETPDIDPANPTIVIPKLRIDMGTTESGKAQSRILGSVAGAYKNGHTFMGSLEMEAQENDIKNYRAQYFQVADTGLSILPKAGISLDIIKNESDSAKSITPEMYALGSIGELKSPFSRLKIYPQVAYLQASVSSKNLPGESTSAKDLLGKSSLSGYQVASYFAYYIGDQGTFLTYNPQYSDLDKLETMKHSFIFGHPLRQDKTLWFNIVADHVSTKSKDLGMSSYKNTTDSNRILFGLTTYF